MTHVDVVVVSYRTEQEVKRLTEDLKTSTTFPYTLHLFNNDGNPKTLTIAWNDLAAQGSGDYIAFFNPDIVICPGWDKLLISTMENRPDLGAILPTPIGSERPVVSFGRTIPGDWPDPPTQKDMAQIKNALGESDDVYTYCATDPCAYYAVVMRRSTFESLRGFDERFTLYGQDHDMQDRLRVAGLHSGTQLSVPFWHGGSLSTKRACEKGEIHLHEEYVRIGQVMKPLRDGSLKRWHELSDSERAWVRAQPRYNRIAGSTKDPVVQQPTA